MKKIILLIYLASYSLITLSQPIIGGVETNIEELPWNVSIQIDGIHHCTGSIVNKYWVVTAAHCMPDGTDIGKLTVKAGSTNQTLPIGQVVAVENYINHSDWNGDPFNGGDVSLIQLKCPLFFNDFAQPIAMDSGGSNSIDIGEFATISGWGCNHTGPCLPLTDILESASIPRISNGEASSLWPGNPLFLASLLPFFELGKAAGQGDSGGPASFIDDNGNALLVGISSFGYPPQEQFPTIYTKVSSYFNFIIDNTLLTNETIVCNCENSTIFGNSNVSDLLDLFRITSVNEIESVEGDFIIDGIFTIDQDLTIHERINLFLTASSEIIIDDGITFTIIGSELNKCGEELWSGITINSGGQLILDNSSISGAYQLIDNNGGVVSATYSYFSDFYNGINIHNGGSFNHFYSCKIIGAQNDLVYENINLGNEPPL